MRRVRCLPLLAGLLLLVGCSSGMGSRYYPKSEPLDLSSSSVPNAQQIVAHINQQAALIQALEAQDLTITVSEGGLNSYTARGWLFYQKPRNFRLQAEALRSTEADLGSNDNEFWFWFKRNKPPALFHCSYNEFAKAKNLNLPVHPDWVAEALGVQELSAADGYQVRVHGQQAVELVGQTVSPQGQVYYKSLVLATKGPLAGRVVQQKLIEPVHTPQGKPSWQEVWVADVSEYQNIGGYIVPRRVTLRCPKEKLTLDLKMDGCQVNPANLIANANVGKTFVRPAGYEEVDLGRHAEPGDNAQHLRSRADTPRQ